MVVPAWDAVQMAVLYASVATMLLSIGVWFISSPTMCQGVTSLLQFALARRLTPPAKPTAGRRTTYRPAVVVTFSVRPTSRRGRRVKRHIWAADNLPGSDGYITKG